MLSVARVASSVTIPNLKREVLTHNKHRSVPYTRYMPKYKCFPLKFLFKMAWVLVRKGGLDTQEFIRYPCFLF